MGRVWCSCASGVPRLNPVSWTFPVPTRHLPLTSCHIYTVLSKTKWQKKENISSQQHFKQKRLWRMGSSGVGMEVGGQTGLWLQRASLWPTQTLLSPVQRPPLASVKTSICHLGGQQDAIVYRRMSWPGSLKSWLVFKAKLRVRKNRLGVMGIQIFTLNWNNMCSYT